MRVELPFHLRTLAGIAGEVQLESDPVSLGDVLDELEARYPMLCGTLRAHVDKRRRPMVRYFACRQDITHASAEDPLPAAVRRGEEPLLIVGAIAGG